MRRFLDSRSLHARLFSSTIDRLYLSTSCLVDSDQYQNVLSVHLLIINDFALPVLLDFPWMVSIDLGHQLQLGFLEAPFAKGNRFR